MTLEHIQDDICRELLAQLEKYHCVRGQLRYQAPSIVSLSGTKEDGKPMLIWQGSPRLPYLLSQYVDQMPDCGGVTINIDLSIQSFNFEPLSIAAIKQAAKEREEQEKTDEKRRQQEYRKMLEQQTEIYGPELASKVADALMHNVVAYGHRDYCGMGLEFHNGTYCYGELWDGSMMPPVKQWTSKEEFIQWLAQQSDASLARLEATEPFYWGNQTITRKRLLELLT